MGSVILVQEPLPCWHAINENLSLTEIHWLCESYMYVASQPGLKPGPLNPESTTLSIRPSCHPVSVCVHALGNPAFSLHSCRDAILPVTCGVFVMYCGTCTQECQHPDVKQMSQHVSCVCKKR